MNDLTSILKSFAFAIFFICFGIFDLYSGGSSESTVYGICFLITGIISLIVTISNFYNYYKHSKEISNFVNSHSGTNLKADCNDYVDSIGFNKIYRYIKNINFCDGIEEKLNGPVEEYLHGVFTDNYNVLRQSFCIIKFRNIKFPTFYSYPLKNNVLDLDLLKSEIDKNPILEYDADFSMCEVVSEEEAQKNFEKAKEFFEKFKKEHPEFEDTEEDDEEDEDSEFKYSVNGKNSSLIKAFFNKEVIKDFQLFAGITDFVEAKDQYLLFSNDFDNGIDERNKLNNKILDIAKNLDQHVDNEFRNEL